MEMVMTKSAASFVVALVGMIQPACAQVTLDVAKITCDQWAGYKITNPQNIALWLSGYLNGTRGNTVLDTQRLTADTQRVRNFCITNPEVPIMQAVEKVIAVPAK
jgi:acid stress chaperone HdeB